MLLSIYFRFLKKRYGLLKEEIFLLCSLLLYCAAQILPLFYLISSSFCLLFLSVFCLLLSIIFRFLGLVSSFFIFVLFFYFVLRKHSFSSFEVFWLTGCLISSYLSLWILLLGLDILIQKKQLQNKENTKQLSQLRKEQYKHLKNIKDLEILNIKTADFCLSLENKNKEDSKLFNQVLEDKAFLEKQVTLLSDQKLFWISNYDNLHQKFLKLVQFPDQDIQDLQNKHSNLEKEFCELDLKYKELLNKQEQIKLENLVGDPLILSQPNSSELSRIQGLYNQLRNQFEDKKSQLSITRKQLFHLEEEVLVQKRDKEILLIENIDLEDLLRIEEKISRLEEEIICLEELVSHILLQ